ncbi:MAG TPA: SynChlorMet cassette protein ScmD [Candidatus Eremiobacteraeota bacterium]|nr:MAG: Coenzyme PQQ synthesis protein D [bacterium ADurb.Bin363]HPZ07595.1 SynChlorMet cassette protein ScmD [Candidatus Eremiobacteraeota bacterium]
MNDKPVANPLIVLRVEFDDWAILFDPDTGDGFSINPTGVFIWKRLDGNHSIQDIVEELKKECNEVPEEVEKDCNEFLEELVKRGLAGYEVEKVSVKRKV